MACAEFREEGARGLGAMPITDVSQAQAVTYLVRRDSGQVLDA